MYAVYVPHEDALWSKTIAPGAGIVGSPAGEWHPADATLGDGRLTVDYEEPGPAANIITFADRVYHAYDRQLSRYPTHKRMWILERELVQVGEFYPTHGRVEVRDGQELYKLLRWLGLPVSNAGSDALRAELACQGSFPAGARP
jgi:hypothetical protein